MQFYSALTLADHHHPHEGGYPGYLHAPTVKEIQTLLSKTSLAKHYKLDEIIDCKYRVTFVSPGYTIASISLIMTLDHPATKSSIDVSLCTACLATIEHNCGVLHLSGMSSSSQRGGIGSLFLQEIMKWCYEVGYTMICCNTAGNQQNTQVLPFFKKHGFLQMGKSYVNARSGNINVWLQKFLRNGNPTTWVDENQDDDWNDEDFDA